MMDTQRLIAFVVFSFSALLLWDAWQKHTAPKVPNAVTAAAPTGVPQPTAPLSTPVAPGGAPAAAGVPAVPGAGPMASGGEPINVKTDLYDIDLNTVGGDIRRLTLRQVHSALDRAKPLTLMEESSKHYFVTQSGLVAQGVQLPIHRSVYLADANKYELGSGKEALEVRLTA